MDKFGIFICESLEQEVEKVLATGDFPDVVTASYPIHCRLPESSQDLFKTSFKQLMEVCDRICILGCGCGLPLSAPGIPGSKISVLVPDPLITFSNSEYLIDQCLQEGALFFLPGRLAHWKEYIECPGFDQMTARRFFGDSVRKIVLLDTRVDPDSHHNLKNLGNYLGLPSETIPVGTEPLRRYLTEQYLRWCFDQEKKKSESSISKANQKSADYAMVVDLLGRMAVLQDEDTVVDNLLELFTILFSPSKIGFMPFHEGQAGAISSRPNGAYDQPEGRARFRAMDGDYTIAENGDGFLLAIRRDHTLLGILAAEDFAFPDRLQDYLNLSQFVTQVFGLSLTNARTYEKLKETVEERDTEITVRKQAEEELRRTKDILEIRVSERTADLGNTNEQLQLELTERKHAEEELRKSEERYRIVADNTYDWEFWINPKGEYIYVSPSCERITGHTRREFETDYGLLHRIAHPDDLSRLVAHQQAVSEHPHAGDVMFRIIRPDGQERWIEHLCQPVFGQDGSFLGSRGSNRDITERKEAERELLRRKEAAEAATLKAQTYLDFIAHDLTNILSPVMMYSEMISTDPRSHPWVKGTATKVVKQIERAASFVRNTRRLSESERDESKRVETVDLRTVLETKEEEIREKYPNKRFNFEHSLPSEGHINAMGKSYIQDIIDEILDNAAKHGKSDDVRIDITLHPIEKLEGHGYWKVEIADYGPGIPDDMKKGLMAEMFEPSNRMRRGIASSLSFMALVAEHIGGRLRIENRIPGDHTKGTKVVLLFPKAGRGDKGGTSTKDETTNEGSSQPTQDR